MPLTRRQKNAARARLARRRGVEPTQISDSEIIAAVSTQEITLTQITSDCVSAAGSSDGGYSGGDCG